MRHGTVKITSITNKGNKDQTETPLTARQIAPTVNDSANPFIATVSGAVTAPKINNAENSKNKGKRREQKIKLSDNEDAAASSSAATSPQPLSVMKPAHTTPATDASRKQTLEITKPVKKLRWIPIPLIEK